MRIKGRLLIAVLVATMLAIPLSGVKAQNKVTVTWMDLFTTPKNLVDYQAKIAADYMAAHPNVTVKIVNLENQAFKDKLTTLMQGAGSGGDIPDLFHSWGGGVLKTYADAGLLKDITPDLTADNSKWLNSFSSQAAMDLYKFDGKHYGVA